MLLDMIDAPAKNASGGRGLCTDAEIFSAKLFPLSAVINNRQAKAMNATGERVSPLKPYLHGSELKYGIKYGHLWLD